VSKPTVAILGAGKLGITLAQLALKADYTVYIASSGEASKIALTIDVLAPGAHASNVTEAVSKADLIILALPLGKIRSLNPAEFTGKLVIDAMNYWWEVDGNEDDLINPDTSSSETVQAFLPGARIVKAFNHMGYHHLHDEAKAAGTPNRKAIAIAGNASSDVTIVRSFVNDLGFDPVVIGNLHSGRELEPGHVAFGANVNAATLRTMTPQPAPSP
jgi:predicted dinucleotide-binding enzyme